MDAFLTDKIVHNLLALGHIALPELTPGWSEAYPEFFVLNQMTATKFSSTDFVVSKDADGETQNLILYCRHGVHGSSTGRGSLM